MYQKMYTTLFNAITKSLEQMEDGDLKMAKWILEEAQRETEAMYAEQADDNA